MTCVARVAAKVAGQVEAALAEALPAAVAAALAARGICEEPAKGKENVQAGAEGAGQKGIKAKSKADKKSKGDVFDDAECLLAWACMMAQYRPCKKIAYICMGDWLRMQLSQ